MRESCHAYVGPGIVTPTEVLHDHALVVCEGRVREIVPARALGEDVEVTRLEGAYLAPGFIDVHVHGGDGHAFNAGTREAVDEIGAVLLRSGVTTALPTLTTAPITDLTTALETLAAVTTAPRDLRADSPATRPWFPGAHLEGPYFSPHQAGAQDPGALLTPADGTIEQLLEYAETISMISFAPELEGAVALTERLVGQGIIAAAGHSNGTDEDLAACQAAGLSHVIHIFSGQSTTIRRGPWRVPGMLESTLASDDLTVEMIADGKHLPPLLMRVAYRALGDRLCLVSDATPGAGLADGADFQMGAHVRRVCNGVAVTADGTSFAGSTTLLPRMVPIAREALGLSVPEAIAQVTTIPARAARLSEVGRLAPGYWADLVLLDDSLTVDAVAVRGSWQTPQPGKELR